MDKEIEPLLQTIKSNLDTIFIELVNIQRSIAEICKTLVRIEKEEEVKNGQE